MPQIKAGMDMPFERPEEPGKRKALILAILVHALLAGFLFFGVHWQTKHEAVEVELWSDEPQSTGKPSPPPVPAVEPPPPPPKPEPKPEPRPEPKPEPKPELKPVVKPDIALKDEKKKTEPKKEEPKKPEPKKEEPKKPEPKKEEAKKPDVPDFAKELEREQQQIKRQQTLAAQREQLNREMAMQQAAGREGAAAGAHSKALGSYGDKIRAKIRGNLGFVSVNGNPTAKFIVTQLPSGEIISVKMVKSSGVPSYDSAVERAINRSSPLPLPDDHSAFQRELNLTFCPQEEASGCPR